MKRRGLRRVVHLHVHRTRPRGALAHERDGHGVGADALARDAAGGVDIEESGSRWLGGCPLRHGFAESSLSPEQLSFCLSVDLLSVQKLGGGRTLSMVQ